MFSATVLAKRIFLRVSPTLVVHRYQSEAVVAQRVTKQLTYYAFNSSNGTNRPIVVVYAWLLAKARALRSVVDFHASKGCDVITVRTSPSEFMWPTRAQRIIDDLFDFAGQDSNVNRLVVEDIDIFKDTFTAKETNLYEALNQRKTFVTQNVSRIQF